MNDIEKIRAIAKAMRGEGESFECSVATTGDEWRLSFAGFRVNAASLSEVARKFHRVCIGLQRDVVAARLGSLQAAEAALRAIDEIPVEDHHSDHPRAGLALESLSALGRAHLERTGEMPRTNAVPEEPEGE